MHHGVLRWKTLHHLVLAVLLGTSAACAGDAVPLAPEPGVNIPRPRLNLEPGTEELGETGDADGLLRGRSEIWFEMSIWQDGMVRSSAWTGVTGIRIPTAHSTATLHLRNQYTADDYGFCYGLWQCTAYAATAHECNTRSEYAWTDGYHQAGWLDNMASGYTFAESSCSKAQGTTITGGGGEEGCTEGYWQQWFFYVNGEIWNEWWEFTCTDQEWEE